MPAGLATGSAAALATAVVARTGATTAARSAEQDFQSPGAGLAVVQACARHVMVSVDPALSGQVAVTAQADHPEEIAQLAVAPADKQARVGLRPGLRDCWRPHPDGSFDRTLALRIRIPAAFPVSVTESGFGDYALGRVGPLSLFLSGWTTLVADGVAGTARIEMSGAGTVIIAELDADRLSADLSGAGTLTVRDGRIGHVAINNSGAARVRIDPVVDSASLSSSGVGGIALGGVRGALSRASSGLGRITVAGRPQPASGAEDTDDAAGN